MRSFFLIKFMCSFFFMQCHAIEGSGKKYFKGTTAGKEHLHKKLLDPLQAPPNATNEYVFV